MAHFAQVENGIVQQVIVAEQDYIDTLPDSEKWIQTSYNTYGGVHSEGKTPLRKNFAGVGSIYDSELDAFYTTSPYPSWSLNTETCLWEPPVPKPEDTSTVWTWDEVNQQWI